MRGRKAKYGAVRVPRGDGTSYDSKLEASRAQKLKLFEKAGVIADLKEQHPISLHTYRGGKQVPIKYGSGRQAVYRADFVYHIVESGELVIEDVKGMDTQLSKLKRAIVAAQTGIEVKVVTGAQGLSKP